jgi:rhamnosyltransferase
VIRQVSKVIFVDDFSGDGTLHTLDKLRAEYPDKVEVIGLERNSGIAKALNVGVRRGRESWFEWVLTLDHDSVAEEGMVDHLFSGLEKHGGGEDVLLVAPIDIDNNRRTESGFIRYQGMKRISLSTADPCGVLEPTVAITSGNLVNTDLFQRIGGFDERLFIDYVDHDFCLRGRKQGLHIIVCANAKLFHSIGKSVSRKLPFGLVWGSSGHSSGRRYTIGRNRFYMIRKYWKDFPGYAFWTAIEYPKDAIGILLCESDRYEKLKMMMKGLFDSAGYYNDEDQNN